MRPGDDNEVSLRDSRSLSPPPSIVPVFKRVRRRSPLNYCSGKERRKKRGGWRWGVGSSSWWVGLGSVPYLCVMRFALRFLRPLARGNPARQQDCAFSNSHSEVWLARPSCRPRHGGAFSNLSLRCITDQIAFSAACKQGSEFYQNSVAFSP